MKERYNVLFLCTSNSARSIIAKSILRRKGVPNFAAHSTKTVPFASSVLPAIGTGVRRGD